LACLPGSDQPTTQAGMAQPEPHGTFTVLPGGRACRARSGYGQRPVQLVDLPPEHYPATIQVIK
jgi:hypothetical protein